MFVSLTSDNHLLIGAIAPIRLVESSITLPRIDRCCTTMHYAQMGPRNRPRD